MGKKKSDYDNLKSNDLDRVKQSEAQVGGGTLPHIKIKSKAVQLILEEKHQAKEMFDYLLELEKPILSILREGKVLFDMFAIFENDVEKICSEIIDIYRSKIL